LNSSFLLTREAVITLAIVAAICATTGSWMKIKYKREKKKAAILLNYTSYGCLALSILIYILLGFK
jgi:hypothetical protein